MDEADAGRRPARPQDERRSSPPQHGFPLRLVVPGWYGMTTVKWLDRIVVVEGPFGGLPEGRRLPAVRRPRAARRSADRIGRAR